MAGGHRFESGVTVAREAGFNFAKCQHCGRNIVLIHAVAEDGATVAIPVELERVQQFLDLVKASADRAFADEVTTALGEMFGCEIEIIAGVEPDEDEPVILPIILNPN